MSKSVDEIMKEVQENLARLRSCPRHNFNDELVSIGKRPTCTACGGQMALPMIGAYIDGYCAHGGDAEDIWPAYARGRARP